MNTDKQKIIILTAPSGAGKTTIKTQLLKALPEKLSFSVSATTRKMRTGETNGVDYHFISEEDFRKKIDESAFVEWEMVYAGMYYGTTVDEMKRIWNEGKTPLLDIDVQGALNVKKQFGEKVLTIFIEPPSMEVLKERLNKRGTDSADTIKTRIDKAEEELSYKNDFDLRILNDDLEKAIAETMQAVLNFI